MANFFDEDAPAKPSGNFFDETPPAAPSQQTILQPRSLSQVGTDAMNFGRVMANTLGIGDSLAASQKAVLADLTGTADRSNAIPTNLAAEKAKTAQASADIGTPATIAANILGGAPVAGATGATTAARLAPYIPKALGGAWTAGVLGSGLENAAVAGGAAAGRGDPIAPAAAVGGVGGAVLGSTGGVTGRGALPSTPSASDFDQQAQNIYNQMKGVTYHPNVVDSAYSQATPTLTKSQLADITPGFRSTIIQQRKINLASGSTSADSIDGFGRSLENAATSPGDKVLAGRISDNLDGVLDNAIPQTGHPVGFASDLQDKANAAIGQRNDLNRISGWEQTAATDPSKDVSKLATNWLNTEEGQRLAPPGSTQNAAYKLVADQSAKAGYIPWWVKHYVVGAGASIAAGETAAYLTGDENSPLARGAEELATGLTMGGAMHGYSQATGSANTAAQQRNIAAAKASIGSGRSYSPVQAPTPIRDALRQLYSRLTPGATANLSSTPTN
jgi:hypothetical protein